jgi:hypothetical protein
MRGLEGLNELEERVPAALSREARATRPRCTLRADRQPPINA